MALKSLKIEGFRAFSELILEDFARLNLIVGKNSTGKTTVLEAIYLYFAEDFLYVIGQILSGREEFDLRGRRRVEAAGSLDALLIEALFHGRPKLEQRPKFLLGPSDGEALSVRLILLRRVVDEADSSIRFVPAADEDDPDVDPDVVPGLQFWNSARLLLPLDRFDRWRRRGMRPSPSSRAVFLSSAGMSASDLGAAWDAIALTEDEERVIEALRMIVPTLDKLVMVQSSFRASERIMMARLMNFREPVPFKSLGEGAFHLLSISLSMIKAKKGYLLIDEIENGIHYSVQSEMWSLIWQLAEAWDVQVFATTHSWDCVKGFHGAVGDADAALFRLESAGPHIRAVSFRGNELAIATAEGIEIR